MSQKMSEELDEATFKYIVSKIDKAKRTNETDCPGCGTRIHRTPWPTTIGKRRYCQVCELTGENSKWHQSQ